MMRSIQIFLSACSLSACLTAQEIRQIEFFTYGQYPVRDIAYIPVDETAVEAGEEPKEPKSIETHSLARMGPYPFKGGSVIRFQNTKTGQLVGRVKIPETSDKWLLIFVQNPNFKNDPKNNLKYLIYPFNDSLTHLPENRLIFLNISGRELDGLLEDKRVKLNRGESDSFRVQESLPINLWTRDFSGERLLPALIKTYSFEANHRYLMIFFPPVLRGSSDLDVRFLEEVVE
ncbi:MAG TPA: hypothetical protein VJ952_09580 [Opitutales bacterium]|nr:hypothetical protein [Opitutales bacterium]